MEAVVTASAAAASLAEMIEAGATVAPSELTPLFDACEAVSAEAMLGAWAGGSFDPDGKGGQMLAAISWHGKRFDSAEDVSPLVCRDEEGRLYDYEEMGAARLRMVEFRGVTSAAMVYDRQPIIDYFRRIDENMIIGLMDRKGAPADFYFHLTRKR